MSIGFGSTETAFEEAEEAAIRAHAVAAYKAAGCLYVTPDLVKRIRRWCHNRAEGYRKKSDEYKGAAEYPDRYSHYWVSIADDASEIVVILRFHHINRRHALSPDGWGMMSTTRLVHVNHEDFSRSPRTLIASLARLLAQTERRLAELETKERDAA